MRFPRKRGSTSNKFRIFIPDNTVTTGAGCTGLAYNSTNLAIAFTRANQNGGTEITGANIVDISTIGTWADPGTGKVAFKAVDASKHPGLYEIQVPDDCAAFGTSDTSESVIWNVYEKTTTALKIGPNMVLIPLVPWDYQDGVRMGLTALPNAAADAAGGLPISDAGGLDMDAKLANTNEVTTARMGALTDLINGGRLDLLIDAIKVATDKLETAMEADSAVYRFTANALEQAPTGGSAPSAADIRAEIDSNSTQLAAIVAKTTNLPSDPADESLIIAATDAIMGRLGAPTGASMSADIAGITANLALIAPTTDASDSATLTTGSTIAGTYTNTQTDDDNRYTLAPVNPGGLDLTLVFEIGLGRAPVSVTINGYWNGSGQYCNVYAYDYLLGIWDQLTNSSTRMASRNSDANYSFGLNREHIDPDTGDVSIRFVSPSTNTAHRLYLDRVLVGTIDQSQGASAGISAQDVWAYAARTLTSDSGEPVDTNAIALAVAALILLDPANKISVNASNETKVPAVGSVVVEGDVTLAALQPNYAPAKASDIPTGDITAIKNKTDNLPSDPADESNILAAIAAIPEGGDATEAKQDLIIAAIGALPTPGDATSAKQDLIRADIAALPTAEENADKLIGRNLAGGSDGGRTVQDALRFNRNKVVVDLIAKTIIVYEEDDTTIAWQGTLSTSAVTQHIIGVDPA